jgi:aspartate kinase
MIVQNVSADGEDDRHDLHRHPKAELDRALKVLEKAKEARLSKRVMPDTSVTKVSVIGVGMRSHAGVAAAHVQGAGRSRHQHPGHHDERDQGRAS